MRATSNARRALRLIMCAALLLGGWACGKAFEGGGPSSTAGSGGGSTGGPAPMSGASGGGIPLIGPGDAGDPCPFNVNDPPPGPVPPETPCDPASDAGACDLPPSVCANRKWLIYYVDPQCMAGFCHWGTKATECPFCDCMNGGCTINFTAK